MARYKSKLDEKMEQAKKGPSKPLLAKSATGETVNVQPTSSQQAAQIKGLPIPPITPLGTQQMGMGPDSAKMAGTPAQKQGAIQQAIQPQEQQTLATAQRTQQARQQTTEEEQAKLEKSEQLKALGSVGEQVHQLLNTKFQAIKAPEFQLTAEDGKPLTETQAALQTVLQNPDATAAEQSQAIANWANEQQELGNDVNLQDLIKMVGDPEQAIAAAIEAGLDTTMDISTSTEIKNMAKQAGIEVPVGMTLKQFQDEVQAQITQEFSAVDNLRRVMNDPNTSPQERAAARKELMDMGALGLSAAEQQAQEIEQQILDADEITFGGEQHSLDDLLDDEYVSGLVSRFYSDDDFAKELMEDNPDFANFLTSNRAALEELTEELEESTKDLETEREERGELAKLPGNLELNSDLIESVFGVDLGKYGEVDTTGLTNSALYGVFKDESIPAEDRANLLNNIDDIKGLDPELAKTFASLDSDKLQKLGAFDPDGGIFSLFKKSKKPGALDELKFAFEGIETADDLLKVNDRIMDYKMNTAFGGSVDGTVPKAQREFYNKYPDIFKDNKIDDAELDRLPLEDLVQLGKVASRGSQGQDGVKVRVRKKIQDKSLAEAEDFMELPEMDLDTIINDRPESGGAVGNVDLELDPTKWNREMTGGEVLERIPKWKEGIDDITTKLAELDKIKQTYGRNLSPKVEAAIKKLKLSKSKLEDKIMSYQAKDTDTDWTTAGFRQG